MPVENTNRNKLRRKNKYLSNKEKWAKDIDYLRKQEIRNKKFGG